MSFGKDLIVGLKKSFTIPSSKEWKDITTINPFFLIILFAISSDSLNSFSSLLIKILNAWKDFVAGLIFNFFSGYTSFINEASCIVF